MTDWTLPDVDPIDWEEEIAACKAKCDIFPAHYSETAIAVLSLPGWTTGAPSMPNMHDIYDHVNGTEAYVWTDGTITTYPDTADDDVIADYMTADPIFRD